MASDKAIDIRDRLSKMVDEVMLDGDQEAHVIACCLAIGIEELEKWMYDKDFTPSVAPYVDDRDFLIPFKPGEDSDDFTGPSWSRKRIPVADKHPALKKAIAKAKAAAGEGMNTEKQQPLTSATYGIDKWSSEQVDLFRMGDRSALSRDIRLKTGAPMGVIIGLIRDARIAHPSFWGIDKKNEGI